MQLLGVDDALDGEPILVLDSLGAGVGARVIASNDGASMQNLIGTKATPARWFVAGIARARRGCSVAAARVVLACTSRTYMIPKMGKWPMSS